MDDEDEAREILDRIGAELARRHSAASPLPALWPPDPPRSGTDWPAVTAAIERSAALAAANERSWSGWRNLVRLVLAPWRTPPRDPLRTAVEGVAAGLQHLEAEVARLHAALEVLEQFQRATTRRLEQALAEQELRVATLEDRGGAAAVGGRRPDDEGDELERGVPEAE